jgi:hypothetical protein
MQDEIRVWQFLHTLLVHVRVCLLGGGVRCVPAIKTVIWRIQLINYVYIINQSFMTRLQITCYVTKYKDFSQAFASYWTGLRYISLHYNTKSWITMSTAYLTGTLSLRYLLCVAGGREWQFKTKNNNNRKWEIITIPNKILVQQISYHLISSTDSISELSVCICPNLNILITQYIFMKLQTCYFHTIFIYFNSQSWDTS